MKNVAQREICPLIAANHSALAEFFRFLRNIPPFRWLNSAKIKKLHVMLIPQTKTIQCKALHHAKYISTFKHTASCNGACNWLAGGLLANEQPRNKSAVVFIVISA